MSDVPNPAAQEAIAPTEMQPLIKSASAPGNAPEAPPAAAGPLFPESILLKVSVAQKAKCKERGGPRGVSRWIKSLIDAA